MSVELSREGWLQLFKEMRRPQGFLQSFFTVKPGGMYNGSKVAIDIQRFGEQVAVAIKKCSGSNLNDFDVFTTKEFTPPTYGEAFDIDACELLDRLPGTDPYEAAYTEYASQLLVMMMDGFMLVDDMISRAVELQASQILQTGKLSLTDSAGDAVYELDFQPKTTHFPTVGTSWSAAGADPLGDLESLADVIRADGKVTPNQLIMGSSSLRNFLNNDDVQKQLDNRRVNIGEIRPRQFDKGATFYGYVWVGAYEFEIWTYPETYQDPQTGNSVKYLANDSVIMLSTSTRLDRTSAKVPLIAQPDPRVAGLIPGRIMSRENDIDVTPNVYVATDNKSILGELNAKPLLIPVAIDGFGCLDTEI